MSRLEAPAMSVVVLVGQGQQEVWPEVSEFITNTSRMELCLILNLTPLRLIAAMRTLLTFTNVAVIHVASLTRN